MAVRNLFHFFAAGSSSFISIVHCIVGQEYTPVPLCLELVCNMELEQSPDKCLLTKPPRPRIHPGQRNFPPLPL